MPRRVLYACILKYTQSVRVNQAGAGTDGLWQFKMKNLRNMMPVSVLGTLSVAVEKYRDYYKIELLDKNTRYTIGHGSA